MKKPVLLKTILDVFFFVLIVAVLGLLGELVYHVLNPEGALPITINRKWRSEEFTTTVAFIYCTNIIITVLFTSCVYYLRELVNNFYRKDLFSFKQIQHFKKIGQLIIIISLANVVLTLLGNYNMERSIGFGINMDTSFSSLWFTLALGLFFIYLSHVFENARKLKEENDFTV